MNKKQLMEILSDPDYPEDFEVFVCNKLGNLRPIDYVCIGIKKNYDYLSKKLYDNNPIEKAEEEFYESLSEKFIVISH